MGIEPYSKEHDEILLRNGDDFYVEWEGDLEIRSRFIGPDCKPISMRCSRQGFTVKEIHIFGIGAHGRIVNRPIMTFELDW